MGKLYAVPQYAADIVAALCGVGDLAVQFNVQHQGFFIVSQGLGIAECHWIGTSMGGLIATVLSATGAPLK